MTSRQLITQTLKHYWRQNLMLAMGVAVSTAVLTGALIVGDSVRHSLERIVHLRLGEITHTISAVDRYFSAGLALRLEKEINEPVAPLLVLEGMASSAGGKYQIPRVQVLGIDQKFPLVTGSIDLTLQHSEVLISRNLAERLNLNVNDQLLIRIKKLSVIPLNTPFVSDANLITPVMLTVTGILADENMGRFDLKNIQTAPYNIFLSLEFLNEIMEAQGKINHLLIASKASSEIESALAQVVSPEDMNLKIEFNGVQNSWEITSDRVFIDRVIQNALESEPFSAESILTYFVNTISFAGRETPYSFVSSTAGAALQSNEIVIKDWLAKDLGASPGDTVILDYFIIGPFRQLEERSHPFVIKEVVPISGKWADKALMPQLPGLSDVLNCRDWETGIPINLEKLRTKDEDYWDAYRGVPKAYIPYGTARDLWTNRFGESTTSRITDPDISLTELEEWISRQIHPMQLGFRVNDIRDQADLAAKNGVDFSQLFLGLSFFLLLASIFLTVLLFTLNTRTRMSQVGTLSFLGLTHRKIKFLWLTEGMLISLVGAIAGLLLAIGYNHVIFNALNSIWSDIVRTPTLETEITLATLAIGGGISIVLSSLAIMVSLNRLLKQSSHHLQTRTITQSKTWGNAAKNALIFLSGFIALALVVWNYLQTSFQNASLLFISGALLLISLLLFVHQTFQPVQDRQDLSSFRPQIFILRNLTHNSRQSFLVVSMFAIATFIIISTGAHRKDLFSQAHEKNSGTGGFLYYGEATIPVLIDLNEPEIRFLSGLEEEYRIVQIREYPGDDASCLNLNRIRSPGILGIDPDDFSGRFRFISKTQDLAGENPWSYLQSDLGKDVIPAIADQSVIQWGLGLKVGDTLQYLDEQGEILNLKLVGGLANSIFQGDVLIDAQHFLRHFPSSSGSNILLVDGDPNAQQSIGEELRGSLRNHGLDLQSAPERLATFNSVENTYLSIFLILGGLGLIIGTLGLAAVLARNLLNRRKELGIMQATGFTRTFILNLITREHFYLLFIGVGIGLISSIVATLPSWLNPSLEVSPLTILILITLIIGNGMLWITWITNRFLKGKQVVGALRSD
ncbi:MAG: ABC transporter permease [Saprospiraceae bacterium]|nr:ABC transporter permease [Saprospiraceae bacterium]